MLWDGFHAFSMHMLLCLAYEDIAIQYTLFLAINRLLHPSSIPIVQTQPPLSSFYTRMIQHNILCISCVHFVHQPLSDPLNIPIRPNHTRYVVESIDMYP